MVAYEDKGGQDGSVDGVIAKRYSNDLDDLDPGVGIFLNQDDTFDIQQNPTLCSSNDGSVFLALFWDWYADGDGMSVSGKFFNSDGSSRAPYFVVN